jgi:hypothetical protein
MSSYIVKSTNIAVTLERIRELVSGSGGSVKEYRRDLVPSLCNTDNSRIQHFYYCDDREGITVRVFDARFASGNPDRRFRDSPIMLRAEKLGNEGAPVKRGFLRSGIHTKSLLEA